MSQELAPAEPARHHPGSRRAWVVGSVLVLLAIAGSVGVAMRSASSDGGPGARPSGSAAGTAPAAITGSAVQARATAIRALLARRSRAILHHDRPELLATIDPTRRAFAADQLRMLANLRRVPLAGWSYTVNGNEPRRRVVALTRYGVPTYAPVLSLRYRLAGFDPEATDLPQYPTFTRRAGRWYLASLDDFAAGGRVSSTDLWDYGQVDVVRRPRVLVLGPPSMLSTMHQVADGLQAAVPRVTAVWGRRWARRVVAQVPHTQRELSEVTGDTGDLAQLAALSSAEISSTAGAPAPVGDRVSVNPRVWPSLDALGRRVVLTHELTHVASRADTGSSTPRWLQEGFADYVGFRGTNLPTTVVAAELARDVRAGRVPHQLPANHQFAGSSPRLAQAYQQGWLACRLIASRAGQRGLVRFYRDVGTSTAAPGPALRRALRQVLGLSSRQFTAQWRGYLRQQLG